MRENELDEALSSAMQETLDQMETTNRYHEGEEEQLLNDFCELLLCKLEKDDVKDRSIAVDVYAVDIEKGILSVRATETYPHPIRTMGTCVSEATVLIDRKLIKEIYEVKFYVDGRLYSAYEKEEGQKLTTPDLRNVSDRTFLHWAKLGESAPAILPDTVIEDASYVAVFAD